MVAPSDDRVAGHIPEENADAIGRRFSDGAEFVSDLPTRLAAIADRWRLTLREPLPVGIGGYLVAVTTSHGAEAVLKLSPTAPPQDRVNRLEAYALRRWAGDGAARLVADDVTAGALLLERCRPGMTIDVLPDDEMISEGCGLVHRLSRVPDREDLAVLPRAMGEIRDRAAELDRVLAPLDDLFSPAAGRLARDSHQELAGSDVQAAVCHGDLNPGNVLSHHGRWVAVDPLPVIAEPSYDAVSLLWSKRSWLLAQPESSRILRRRLDMAADALDVDRDRVRAWTMVRLVGLIEDRMKWGGYNEAAFLEFADLLAEI
jgi:streptomycin 6-kinase